jgi:hypothetical protein
MNLGCGPLLVSDTTPGEGTMADFFADFIDSLHNSAIVSEGARL